MRLGRLVNRWTREQPAANLQRRRTVPNAFLNIGQRPCELADYIKRQRLSLHTILVRKLERPQRGTVQSTPPAPAPDQAPFPEVSTRGTSPPRLAAALRGGDQCRHENRGCSIRGLPIVAAYRKTCRRVH